MKKKKRKNKETIKSDRNDSEQTSQHISRYLRKSDEILKNFKISQNMSRLIKTYQDISRHLETFQGITMNLTTSQNILRYLETHQDISRHFKNIRRHLKSSQGIFKKSQNTS